MSVDVQAVIDIRRPRAEIGEFVFEPGNDARWIGGVRWSRVVSASPMAVGARIRRQASFLGRTNDYEMEIVEFQAGRLLEMRTVSGLVPMVLAYRLEDAPGGARMTVLARVDATGAFAISEPLLAAMVRRDVERDLRTLKSILESAHPGAH